MNFSTLSRAARAEESSFSSALSACSGSPTALSLASHAHLLHTQRTKPTRAQLTILSSLCTAFAFDAASTLPGLVYLGHLLAILHHPETAAVCYARSPNPLALYLLAQAYESGQGVPRSFSTAAALYEQLIPSGFPAAHARLAKLLSHGCVDLPADPSRAADLYEFALSRARNHKCLDALADLYAEGAPGLSPRPERAVALYEESIETFGTAHALSRLARLLERGAPGVRADPTRAEVLYEAAVEVGGDVNAMVGLAEMLASGTAGRTDFERAVGLCEVAVAREHVGAKRLLARILENGEGGVPQNRKRAVELYEQVVQDPRHKAVRFNLAWLLSSGLEDVPQDATRAAELYEEVISEDADVNAMFNLASLLTEEHDELERDIARSVALLERAVDEGDHVYAMHTLGALLGTGQCDVPVDKKRAVTLLERAVDAGRREAMFDLALVLSGGTKGEPMDMNRAMQCYQKAIDTMDHMGAMINVSEILCEGRHGIEKDICRAKVLCERAVAQGYAHDQKKLAEIGISQNNLPLPKQDAVSQQMNALAVQQGWHLVALCNLTEIVLSHTKHTDLEKAVKYFTAATSEPVFAELCEVQGLEFGDMFKVLKTMVRPDATEEEAKAAIQMYACLIEGCGNAHAMYLLAQVFRIGAPGVPKNLWRAMELYKMAASNGEAGAMMVVGEMLCTGGEGLAMNKPRGFNMFVQVLQTNASPHLQREAVVNMALLGLELQAL